MDIGRLLSLVAGLAVVLFATGMSMRTFMLPGAGPHFAARVVFRAWQHLFLLVGRLPRSDAGRESVLSLYAPTALLTMVAMLVALLGFGYALVFYGAGTADFAAALTFSASSISTLGFANPDGSGPLTVLTVLEAMSGATTIALLIGYLPTIFQNFQQREQAIAALEAHVGDASSAVAILQHWADSPGLAHADGLWAEWTAWFASLATSHRSLSGSLFLRSPASHRSWVATAGAMLDAAALASTTLDLPTPEPAERCLRAGAAALRQIVAGLRLPGAEPAPASAPRGTETAAPARPISVSRAEYDAACAELAAAGLPLKADRDGAWAAFSSARATYDAPLLALCRLKRITIGLWSGDRPEARPHLHLPVFGR